MDAILGNFTPVSITRDRLEELLVAEKDANRMRNLIRKKVENYDGLSYAELSLLAAFLRIEAKDPFESEKTDESESEDIENG